MPLKKLDEQGNYTHFPGITVIASVNKTDTLLRTIYEMLIKDKEFTDYFSPLPFSSYHMTTINLFTEEQIGSQKWKSFITGNNPLFQSLHQMINDMEFTPSISIDAVELAGALQLRVTLPEEQLRAISQIASSHNVQMGIPAFFHITLAYQYKRLDVSVMQNIKLRLTEELIRVIGTSKQPLLLNSQQLCYFNDMSKFIPWNGNGFPFSGTFEGSSSFFAEKDKETSKKKEGPSSSCVIL
ncbi:MAG: DUF1868 domain-containing protein [Legionella sp.]|nr:DUF1868 domain-containing protein [Legionella sp.]